MAVTLMRLFFAPHQCRTGHKKEDAKGDEEGEGTPPGEQNLNSPQDGMPRHSQQYLLH